jgi:hypothetical protein
MDKRTTTNALNELSLVISRRSANLPDTLMGAALPVLKPIRLATVRSMNTRVAPESLASRSVKLRATWKKAEDGRLVCHWTHDLE